METTFQGALARVQYLVDEFNRNRTDPVAMALIGGLALGAWGVVRATQDIDVLLKVQGRPHLDAFLSFLSDQRVQFRLRSGPTDDPIPLLVEIDAQETLPIFIHLLVTTRGWEAQMVDEAIAVELEPRHSIRVVKAHHLLLLKIRAGGPQDLLDAANLKKELETDRPLDVPELETMARQIGVLRDLRFFLKGQSTT